ncbi:Nup133 N terminal like-domain-containing protein [Radiomyces spectabilis]|uniref:Nup133 N terminal like-domain-containing protein n=1 Tax=Radiomyces spectabilis TaxID=64574 RepID=UPI0022204363|nr:Nup133 N terminal like-domain-containing protein [Radiomyces spectabilis]KAI8391555.1 Nup133 N terminal like-domain-containing protein [Radiomyces spectabilis]
MSLNRLSSEEIGHAVIDAATIVDHRKTLDIGFPDISDAFTADSLNNYEVAADTNVQSIVLKHAFTMPPSLLQPLQQNRAAKAGILTDINMLYFIIGNQLYLWDYVERTEAKIYEDASEIVNVAVVKPKANIFNDEVSHVLVVATKRDISLVALSFKRDAGNNSQVTFYRSGISTSSSGVQMVSIIGNQLGRIFMLGDDGNVWELEYKQEEGWFTNRCFKRLHPTVSTLSFFMRSYHDPCVAIALNETGDVLYQLFNSSHIQVTYLGKDQTSFINVAKHTNIAHESNLMCPNSPLLDNAQFKIISIHPTLESKKYQLVAITSTGCRLYFTQYKRTSNPSDGPTTLELIHVRTPPTNNLQQNSATPTSVSSNAGPSPQVVGKTLYKDGVLLLVNKINGEERLISACPDIGRLANLGARAGLAEFSSNIKLEGDIIAMTELAGPGSSINELAAAPSSRARHFLVFTTTTVNVLMKQRPVDMLHNLLMSTGTDIRARMQDFQFFFNHFGPVFSCALCFDIVSSTVTELPSGVDLTANPPVSASLVKGATELLARFGSSISMFRESTTQSFTSRHDGLALYIHRLITPAWLRTIVSTSPNGQYISTLPRKNLLTLQATLSRLHEFLQLSGVADPLLNARTAEEQSLWEQYIFIALVSETLTFLLYLLDNDPSKLVQSLSTKALTAFRSITLKDLLTTSEGRSLCCELVKALEKEHLAKYGNADLVHDVLQSHCSNFSKLAK